MFPCNLVICGSTDLTWMQRAGQLKSHGFTPETSPELAQIIGYISTVQNSMAGE